MRGFLMSGQRAVGAVVAALATFTAGNAFAQSAPNAQAVARWPEKPVHVYLGFAAGGLPDTVGRLVQQKLAERWGVQVIMDNRPGAGGITAADIVARAAPDGYSLHLSDASVIAVNPFTYPKLNYSERDFEAVSIVARSPLFLAVNSSVPVANFQELIALARARPGELSYGSSGIGTVHHLSMEALNLAFGVQIMHVPYKGTGQSVPAMVSGQVAMVFSAYPSLASYARDGRVRLIAENQARRSSLAPNVPSVAEMGAPGFDYAVTNGYMVPAGTPREIIQRISQSMAEVVKLPDIVERFTALGIEPVGSTPEEHAAAWKSDTERFSRIVRAARVRAE